jgi:acyl-homoserine lactone acylase PvdQ
MVRSSGRGSAGRRRILALLATFALLAVPTWAAAVEPGSLPGSPAPTDPGYRLGDYADGQARSVLPPGENGLVNAADAAKFEAFQERPPGSDDQLGQYRDLLYGAPSLTDSNLGTYFNDESFGVQQADITRVEQPGTDVTQVGQPDRDVTIYRDTHQVPHVYGTTDASMAFGAGFAQAEDRLFLMDVLRHYGSGTLAMFLGASCDFEQMDHDQLLLSPYTPARAQAQVDNLPKLYGAQGALAKKLIDNYVDGVNAYIAQTRTNPTLLPADYAAALQPPLDWSDGDVVAISGLIGGIFGKGGGSEVANAALLQYLQKNLGAAPGKAAFTQFKSQNDPGAPTTIVDKSFPYMIPGTVNPATTALPDDARAPLTGGPTATTPGCDLTAPNPGAKTVMTSLQAMPQHMSNALVVNGNHATGGHPIAVFGPQVSYFAPQILAIEDLHSPNYSAAGASFPGTGLVELGRGADYAWSATSAGSDLIDQRLEKVCKPGGGTPDREGKYYLFRGVCRKMTHEVFEETAIPKPGGPGTPTVIRHDIYRTSHGVVQGWTTSGRQPVAVVNQRSTYEHDIDSVVGFLRWGQPALTHDVQSWKTGAAQIGYTFNWFYVDDRDTGYFVSGRDPVRPAGVDPNLPSWGTGNAEWSGFLPAGQHPQEVNPAQGFFVSWNNKPAPKFSAADEQYGYGPVFRSQLLVNQLTGQLSAHGGHVTRSQVVQAMETAASQDLDGVAVLPQALAYLQNRVEPPGVSAMLAQLQSWAVDGSHRKKAAPTDAQYQHAAAVAIMDELMPQLIRAVYDPLLVGGGLGSVGANGGATDPGYAILPMQFVNTPNSGGQHLGSAYDGGYEGYLQKTFAQLRGQSPPAPFGSVITSRWCGSGPASCPAAIDTALMQTYNALVTANNGSTDVASWTASSASKAAGQTMPQFDAIAFRALGIVGQPNIDWQNRPTFQQVVQFPRHRPRT